MIEFTNSLGIIIATLATFAGLVEGIKYFWAARPITKRKSSKDVSRKYYLTALICLTPQFIFSIWGMFFPTGHDKFIWPICIGIAWVGTLIIFYLACKYKRKDGKFSWPTWRSV